MTKALSIVKGRLLESIHHTAQFGAKGVWGKASTETGVCRLTLSDLDKQVRDWFIAEAKKLGCKVKIDTVGNIFAVFPGKNEAPPTAIGSHLDTQPTGGRYDGILGVLSGLEVLKIMKENSFVPEYPIAVVNWTNEEGARFPMSLMASSVWAENVPESKVLNLQSITDQEPVTVEHELNRIGYKGDTIASYKANPLAAHFELHIEQGPILENENKKIGIVTGVQAYDWCKVTVFGNSSHTGTTPLNSRSDALFAVSRMIAKCNEIAHKHNGLVSVGVINIEPAVVNVIPNKVSFIYDARHSSDEGLAELTKELKQEFESILKESNGPMTWKPLEMTMERTFNSKAAHFHKDCISCVKDSSISLFGESNVREIMSGAGHDSCATSTRCPTSMIFIPSRNGVSHSPEEYSTPEQVDEGLEVLLGAVLRYDELRTA